MIINRNAERLFGFLLTDDILIEHSLDLRGLYRRSIRLLRSRSLLLRLLRTLSLLIFGFSVLEKHSVGRKHTFVAYRRVVGIKHTCDLIVGLAAEAAS